MALARAELKFIQSWIRRQAGIVMNADKEVLIEARLETLSCQENYRGAGELIQALYLNPDGPLAPRILDALTTHETSFFRDAHPFEALKHFVLPELIRSRSGQTLRIWCAACSYGQEPYSTAILIREYFPSLAGVRLRILGTDISEGTLNRARRGEYHSGEICRGLPENLRDKYFLNRAGVWAAKEEIRCMVEFQIHNLAGPQEDLGRFDVIFLRNVLIYFDREEREILLSRTAASLRAGGYLFLGTSESPDVAGHLFRADKHGRSMVYRLK